MPVSAFFFLGNGTGQSGWGGPTLKKQKIEQVVDRFALSSCVVVSVSPPKGVRDHPLPPRKKDEKKTPQSGPFSLCFFFFFFAYAEDWGKGTAETQNQLDLLFLASLSCGH